MIKLSRIIKVIREYPNLTPTEAKLILFLYDRGGFASHSEIALFLERPIKEDGDWAKALTLTKVFVHRIRKEIGKPLLVSVWGQGYDLTPNARLLSAVE